LNKGVIEMTIVVDYAGTKTTYDIKGSGAGAIRVIVKQGSEEIWATLSPADAKVLAKALEEKGKENR